MRVLVQRSLEAKCIVDNEIIGMIPKGLVIFVGFTEGDDINNIKALVRKVVNLRIFEDENNVMNKSILDIQNIGILSISQFTLYADTTKGNRPSYIKALNSGAASKLYDLFNQELAKFVKVETGRFGADMKIDFTNDGPITILLEK